MEKIKNLFPNIENKKERRTERGDLLEYFKNRINASRRGTKFKPVTIPRVAKILQGLTKQDLYYMKSYMEDLERSGKDPVKWFWWSLKNTSS